MPGIEPEPQAGESQPLDEGLAHHGAQLEQGLAAVDLPVEIRIDPEDPLVLAGDPHQFGDLLLQLLDALPLSVQLALHQGDGALLRMGNADLVQHGPVTQEKLGITGQVLQHCGFIHQ